jgi:A/G-specific adenine glycosylase
MAMNTRDVERFRKTLLTWYDKNKRILPWRAASGQPSNPYHVWLSEIMLQQTTVAAVIPYFNKFIELWPTVEHLANAPQEEILKQWAGLGYYARARNLHKCAIQIAANGGAFPEDQDQLKKLPGVGNYTSAAIRAIAFNKPANVVDGNVERVMARVFAVSKPLPDSKPNLKLLATSLARKENKRPGDYAQALMDLGAMVCTPTSPKCGICPISTQCKAYALGKATKFPIKKAKPQRPKKYGYVYIVMDEGGKILTHTRPEQGLLGGMRGLPTSAWVERREDLFHTRGLKPVGGKKTAKIRHVFTHFELELQVVRAQISDHFPATMASYHWESADDLAQVGFPTVFKKVVKLA